ncbi:MAG: helix-turn-helix domain-containing protein, partial [Planctomycetota bacterium]
EWMAIERAMERNNGDKKAAAEELGVSVKTLYNRINAAAEDQAA